MDYGGNPLKFYTLEFELLAPQKQVEATLNKLEDFIKEKVKRGARQWMWADNRETNITSGNPDKNALMRVDTKVMHNMDHYASKRIFADVRLTKDRLTISIHSTQRAHIAQDIIASYLWDLVKNAVIEDMINIEIRASNRGFQHKIYEFGVLLESLGIKK